jgi:hypothetical protein
MLNSTQIVNLIDSEIIDNTSGLISALVMRDVLTNIVESSANLITNNNLLGLGEFDIAGNYSTGGAIIYNNNIYKCIVSSSTLGTFVSGEWTQIASYISSTSGLGIYLEKNYGIELESGKIIPSLTTDTSFISSVQTGFYKIEAVTAPTGVSEDYVELGKGLLQVFKRSSQSESLYFYYPYNDLTKFYLRKGNSNWSLFQTSPTPNTFSNGLTKYGNDVQIDGQFEVITLTGGESFSVNSYSKTEITAGTIGLITNNFEIGNGITNIKGDGTEINFKGNLKFENIPYSSITPTTTVLSKDIITGQISFLDVNSVMSGTNFVAPYGINGINYSASGYKLGGTLTENTTIDSNTFNLNFSGTNGIKYLADYSSNYTNRTLVDKGYVDNQLNLKISENTTAGNGWSILGNTFSARGILGSTSGAFGYDEVMNSVVFGGVNNDKSRFYGTTESFVDTNYSFQTLGNTSDTYGFQIKNIDNTSLFSVRNDGQNYSKKHLFGGPLAGLAGDSTVELWGEAVNTTGFIARFRQSDFTTVASVRNDGLFAYSKFLCKGEGGIINGYDDSSVAYFYAAATDDIGKFVAKFRKSNYDNILEMRSDGNIRIGEQVATYGGGAGVLFISNATTAPTTAPSNGYVDFGFQGTKRAVSSGGFHTMLAGNYTAVAATYTALTTDANIECTANTFTVTLFTAVTVDRTIRTITNTGAGTITVDCTGGQTINGAATVTLLQWESLSYYPNGTNFIKV